MMDLLAVLELKVYPSVEHELVSVFAKTIDLGNLVSTAAYFRPHCHPLLLDL